MKVAVLGAGPAGLMAAHGAVMSHSQFDGDIFLDIYARGDKSPLYGAQYLHKPIPLITPDAPRQIDYRLVGSEEGYRSKVYGPAWDGIVSPGEFSGLQRAWNIRLTYDQLWSNYSRAIIKSEITPSFLRNMLPEYDIIINTVPRPSICYGGHDFRSTEIIAAGDAPDLGINIGSMFRCEDETVICNGNESPSWYRLSRIFGHTTVEWPAGLSVPVNTASTVRKPLENNCDCWASLLHVGRFGEWRKGVLSHDAFFRTYSYVDSVMKEFV